MAIAIEVKRSPQGIYEIPGAAEAEDWDAVQAEMVSVQEVRDLNGWEPWERVYTATDEDGNVRWYFVRDA